MPGNTDNSIKLGKCVTIWMRNSAKSNHLKKEKELNIPYLEKDTNI
jgi:hypothetical protein